MAADLIRRWLQFAQLAAGVLIFTAGVVQCTFSHPFRRDRNRALITLGIAGVLYGARLLAGQPQVRDLVPAPPLFWLYLDAYVTYVILVPVLYFIELTFGAGRYQSIRWIRWVVTGYAVIAIVTDAMTRTPRMAKGPNGYLVIAAIVVLIWNRARGVIVSNTFRAHAGAARVFRVVSVGLLVFGGFVLFENIVNDRVLQGVWNVEWAGVLVLLACLGYVAVSQSVDNDRRLRELRHELETARQIQKSILPPQMPTVAGLDVAARYLPMAAVAGDFYDFLELGGGQLGILVADVSGHGVPAALIASMVKVAFVAQSEHADDPGRVLDGMNKVFCGRLDRQFVTAAYVYLDVIDGRLRYGAAGHPPALLVSRSGDVEEIAENGVMLGHFPEWIYTSVERTLRPGDRLILYTDGLIEASDARGEFFDGERLRAFSRTGPALRAEAFVDALVSHVSAWIERPPARGFEDDVTIVVVDRLLRS